MDASPRFNIFLTEREKDNVSEYTTSRPTRSAVERLVAPLVELIARRVIPSTLAPNILSLCSSLLLIQGWYVSFVYGESFPRAAAGFALFSILAWFVLDSLDAVHARLTGNESALVELFDHMCSSVGSVFLVMTLCNVFGVTDVRTIWLACQIIGFKIASKHVQAFCHGSISYGWMRGPGEAVAVVAALLLARLNPLTNEPNTPEMGLLYFKTSLEVFFSDYVHVNEPRLTRLRETNLSDFVLQVTAFVYLGMQLYVAIEMMAYVPAERRTTRGYFLLCLFLLAAPVSLDFLTQFHYSESMSGFFTLQSVLADALALCALTTDLVVARMGQRELSPFMVVLMMINAVSVPATIMAVALYYITLLFEISVHTRLPVFSLNVNVYVDGIFDMVHIGHLKHFGRAAKLGTRLLVGVVNDEDAAPYKRKPIMTHEERCDLVAACKHVYKVIPNAPCVKGGLNEAFLRKHNIHIVGCGQEYEVPGDEWYAVPRRLGMTRVLPRTTGMSTSDLIERILSRSSKETKGVMT